VRSALLLALTLALLAVACGSDGDGSGTTVSATTGILADITRHVAGADATVEQVIPDSASPHDFALSAQDRAKIEDSALLVENGALLEGGIPLDRIDVEQWALADHVGPLLPFRKAGSHEPGGTGEEEVHDSHDPHVWMDPTRVAAALPSLADALAAADPEHAGGYRARAAKYAKKLRAVDAEVAASLAGVPADDRKLVTSHDALGYFGDRYGFEVVATPFPASGPEAEASAAAVRDVEDTIERTHVPAVFSEETDDPKVLEQIADRTGVAIVEDLLVEAPGSAGTYVGMLKRDAQLISASLSGR
jgi:zinc/manganese transport system substrate-binding protein